MQKENAQSYLLFFDPAEWYRFKAIKYISIFNHLIEVLRSSTSSMVLQRARHKPRRKKKDTREKDNVWRKSEQALARRKLSELLRNLESAKCVRKVISHCDSIGTGQNDRKKEDKRNWIIIDFFNDSLNFSLYLWFILSSSKVCWASS